jgi:hypothetical protein
MNGVTRRAAILIAGKREAMASAGRDEIRAISRDEFRLPNDDLRVGFRRDK